MPRKNDDIPRLQSRSLAQSLRLRKPTANMLVGTQCIKKPFYGITPTDKHTTGCNKNTGRIKSGQHRPLINGDSLQLNAKVNRASFAKAKMRSALGAMRRVARNS